MIFLHQTDNMKAFSLHNRLNLDIPHKVHDDDDDFYGNRLESFWLRFLFLFEFLVRYLILFFVYLYLL